MILRDYVCLFFIATSSCPFIAPPNQIKNEARVNTDKDTAIPLPNSDTPYFILWMDLRTDANHFVLTSGGEGS
jgi:hypothetical protein